MDGVHLLRKRHHSRLWYRAMPVTVQPPIAQPTMASGTDLLMHVATVAEAAAWDDLLAEPMPVPPAPTPVPTVVTAPVVLAPVAPAPVVTAPVLPESVRQTRRLGQSQPVAKETANAVAAPVAEDQDEWRVVPETAPSLMLSATDLLDARNPGPVLRPGSRYRIGGVQNGIVGLYVTTPDGESGLGFCAAVDLICIDSRFHRYKSGRTLNVATSPIRSRVQRLTGGLSQATTSLLGAAASHSSR
jgi:hypothetical protein